MADSKKVVIEKAIDERREVIASITVDEKPIVFRGQFHGRSEEGFAFQPHIFPSELGSAGAGLRAVISFGASGAAIEFQADVVAIEKNSDNGPAVIRCGPASEINITQRRAHFRAPANSDSPMEMTVWKVPPHWVLRDRPKPSMQLRIEVVDLSVGGTCLHILPHRLGPDAVAMGDRLRIGITHKGEEAVLDGQIIYRSGARADGSVRVGVEFRKAANSIESRRASTLLNQIIAAIQRQNIRIGVAMPA